jgi:hypothetical protein
MIRQRLLQSSRSSLRRKCSLSKPTPSCCNTNSSTCLAPSSQMMFPLRYLHLQPLPLPAVAHCDYEEEDDYEETETHFPSSSSRATNINMTSDTPRFLGNNYRISGTTTGNSSIGKGSGGGGGIGGSGGSKHRCPKCGAFVTFQENNSGKSSQRSIQSCFYCAACSGWFLVQNGDGVSESGIREENSKYLTSKLGKEKEEDVAVKRGDGVQFVMQDVSLFLCWCFSY